MMSLELKNIRKGFANKALYHNLSFTFQIGCYAIIGPNGVGKTVLLEMLAGISTPDGGEISLKNCGAPSTLAYKRQLAYIPSKPEFFPLTTGNEFLNFIAAINLSTTQTANQLVADFQLTAYLKTKFADMSLGTQKKLFLTTLTIGTKSLLILDEPTNGLDKDACQIIAAFLRAASQQAIVILATHDQALLKALNPTIIPLTVTPITVKLNHHAEEIL